MANFLDLTTGLPALWAKIKSKFYTKAEVDALIPEDEVMWVHITENNGVYSSDKTFDEIYNHIHSDGIAYIVFSDNSIYPCIFCDTEFIAFEYVSVQSTDKGDPYVFGKYIMFQKNTDRVTIEVSNDKIIHLSNDIPYMDGIGYSGQSTAYARADHVHPTDTSRAAVADVLTKTNTTSYTPTANYHPATKKYVDDHSGATYTLSMSGNVITLTGSDSSTSSVTLPVFGGTSADVWEGGVY